ncbi:MAG TPA: acetoin utilization protein AcuC [Verrucomicrobiota bacterium]|nr:acetoin utilization protein AcuC [Verrucomicrobiota bacterium]
MSNRRLAFLYSPDIEALSYPPDCPFKTQRAGVTRQRLKSFGLLGDANHFEVAPRRASLSELARFHTAAYLNELNCAAMGDLTARGFHMGLGGQDTPVFRDMFDYGAWACGAGLTGAQLLLLHKADVVFNLLGGFHHAFADHAGGFCYLNDVVLACMELTGAGRRVLYLDVDAHHGDGVQSAFYERNDVFTISMHESGKTLFPWGGFENETGDGDGFGYNVNIPLPAETYDDAFVKAFDHLVVPLADNFCPDAVVLELGMDILAGDPLTHLRMTNNVVVEIVERVMRWNCPVLVAGGGGYHIEHTVRGWALAWRTFSGWCEECDFGMGMGGVMLENDDWAGGLRDRVLPVTEGQRGAVEPALDDVIARVERDVFPLHGLATTPANHCAAIMGG